MRVLIDTNIFIELEGTTVLDQSYPALLKILQDNHFQLFVHPSSVDDLKQDTDTARLARNLSRITKYQTLPNPPDCTAEFAAQSINCRGHNNEADCKILCAVYKDAVAFLITEDQGIHRKSRKLGIQDRVFFVTQALNSLTKVFGRTATINLPNIEQIFVHQLRDELPESFFNSLRAGYAGFDDWFIKCCRTGREAWIARNATMGLGALCLFKTEESEPLTDEGTALAGSSLKLCTFKVDSAVQGQKIGELFLKAAFKYASQNGLEHIYLTAVKGQQPHLEAMLLDFGFYVLGCKKNEVVYVKDHPKRPPAPTAQPPLEYHKKFCPHLNAENNIRKFLIPIKPEYHEILFPEWGPRQLKIALSGHSPAGNPVPGNALKLAYLCHSNCKQLRPGDVLLFYRSGDVMQVTTIGIVEYAEQLNDKEEILAKVLKRTVYSIADIEKTSKRNTLTILFRLATHVKNAVTREFLTRNGIEGNIQSIRKIEDTSFRSIITEASIQDCILTN